MEAVRNLAKNWLLILAVAVLGVASGMVTSKINDRNAKVEGAASVKYVDTENDKQDEVIDELGNRVDSKVDLREFYDHKQTMMEDFKYLRDGIDDIKRILIEKDK